MFSACILSFCKMLWAVVPVVAVLIGGAIYEHYTGDN